MSVLVIGFVIFLILFGVINSGLNNISYNEDLAKEEERLSNIIYAKPDSKMLESQQSKDQPQK